MGLIYSYSEYVSINILENIKIIEIMKPELKINYLNNSLNLLEIFDNKQNLQNIVIPDDNYIKIETNKIINIQKIIQI
jgi:hypothetical protein